MTVGLRHLSNAERIRVQQKGTKSDPLRRVFADLQIEVASRRGGRHLELFQLARGYLWADPRVEPTARRVQEAAIVMNLPLPDAQQIYNDVMGEVIDRLQSTPEWQAWAAGRKRELGSSKTRG
jgi:hypothetical protein